MFPLLPAVCSPYFSPQQYQKSKYSREQRNVKSFSPNKNFISLVSKVVFFGDPY